MFFRGPAHGSVYYQLLAKELVFPTFYSRLYPDLRAALTAATRAPAQQAPACGPRTPSRPRRPDRPLDDLCLQPRKPGPGHDHYGVKVVPING